jgi:TetR/AcrR family transcriptional regulator, acrAB operon repressor
MPKIRQVRVEENQRRIEAAALALFTKQGFHGTNIRQIAEKAEVSTGAIYTYYRSKEALFVSLVRNYETRMKPLRDQMFNSIKEPFSKEDIRRLAAEIRSIVYDNADYWRLMYIDVIEFKNQHFAQSFQGIVEKMRHRLGPLFKETKRRQGWCGKDPAFVFASIYMYIFEYFLIEKLFQGNQHLGVSDEKAIEGFVDLFSQGIWKSAEERATTRGARDNNSPLGSISVQKRKLRAFALNGGSQ